MSKDCKHGVDYSQDAENNLNSSTIERCPHDKENPYVMISRDFTRNADLSFEARGFLLYLLSNSAGWKISRPFIMRTQKITEHSLKKLIDELIKAGFMKMERYKAEKGYRRIRYFVSENPKFKENIPHCEIPPEEIPPEEIPGGEKPGTKERTTKKNLSSKEDINKEEKKDICSEQSKKTDSKPGAKDFFYSLEKGEYEGITEKDMDQWKIAYPSIDLSQQIAKSVQWLKSNPHKAKLKKKWRSYLTGWLGREEEKESNRQAYNSSKSEGQKSSPPPRFEGEAKSTGWKPSKIIKGGE